MTFLRSLGIAAWLVCATASAAPQTGDYAAMDVGGWLKISPGPGQSLKFRIDVLGGNASMCDVEGAIQGSQARVEAFGQSCVIDFKDIPDGLEVSTTTTPSACRVFCGNRAIFEGQYIRSPPACTPDSQRRARAGFLALYRKQSYAQAIQALQGIHESCARFTSFEMSVRDANDLAVALFHVGDMAGCRRVLVPVLSELTDARLQEMKGGAPTDYDIFSKIAASARFNDGKCQPARN